MLKENALKLANLQIDQQRMQMNRLNDDDFPQCWSFIGGHYERHVDDVQPFYKYLEKG